MRAALTIARKELSQRLRDKSFFIVGIAAPLVLALIFNLVLGGVLRRGDEATFSFGVYDADHAELSAAFGEMLAAVEANGLVEVTRFETLAAAEAAVDAGDVDAVFILPESLSVAFRVLNQDAVIRVIGNVDADIGRAVATAIAEEFARTARTAALAAATALAAGAIPVDEIGAATAAAATAILAAPPIIVAASETPSRQLPTATFFIAGLGIFFMFFIVGLTVTSMLGERSDGTLARLLGAPIPPAAILAGKMLANIGLGILAMAILVVASTVLMGAEWGSPLPAAAVILAAILAAAGVMIFVGGLARTSEQASNLQSIVALTFAMLGGTFVPITTDEGLLGTLRYLSPNAWYMRGLGDVSGGAYGQAYQAVAVLLVIGLAFGAAGLVLVRRLVRP